MKKYSKRIARILSVIYLLSLFSTLVFLPATAVTLSNSNNTSTISEQRKLLVFQELLGEMSYMSRSRNISSTKDNTAQAIESISCIHDFAGNTYTLIDCTPTGYMIYHDASGNFVEYSPSIHSPYYGLAGEKYYAGPNEYYLQPDNSSNYIHIIDGSSFTEKDVPFLIDNSAFLNKTLTETPNTYIIDFISEESTLSLADLYTLEERVTSTGSRSANDWTYVNNYSFFQNLSNCGYTTVTDSDGNTLGICGYIAAGILLVYDKVVNSVDTVNNNKYTILYSYANGAYSIEPTLPIQIYTLALGLGYDNSTTSVEIHYTIKQWLENMMVDVTHTSLYTPFASKAAIADKIDANRPVIWFGYVNDNPFNSQKGNHAVVVYGYSYSFWNGGYSLVAHFGWPGATEVYFNGALGSMYTYTVNE